MAAALPWLIPAITSMLPSILEKFSPGQKEQFKQIQTMSPQQMGLFNQMAGGLGAPLGQGLGYLGEQLRGYEPGQSPMEKMAMQQFQTEFIPQLSETFTGMGAGSSSGFGQQMAAGAGNLATQMAGMRQQQQQSAMQMLMQMLGQTMGAQPYATQYIPGRGGMGAAMAPGMGSAAASMLPELIKQLFAGRGSGVVNAPSGQWQKGNYGADNVYYRTGG